MGFYMMPEIRSNHLIDGDNKLARLDLKSAQ
jgi:hypothetical protein